MNDYNVELQTEKTVPGPKKKVGVLFSAGIDSTMQIALLLERGYDVYPITFDDDSSMTKLKRDFALEFWLSRFDLVRNHINIRYMRREELRKPSGYVPGWKLTMIMSALAYCDRFDLTELHVGYLKDDRYPYPDEGPDAFNLMSDTYYKIYSRDIPIVMSLVNMTKVELIQWGMERNLPFEKTFSCRDVTVAGLTHCGKCDVCKMRYQAFRAAGYVDPAYYLTLEYVLEPLKNGERNGYQQQYAAELAVEYLENQDLDSQKIDNPFKDYKIVCDDPAPNYASCCNSSDLAACDCVNKNHITVQFK